MKRHAKFVNGPPEPPAPAIAELESVSDSTQLAARLSLWSLSSPNNDLVLSHRVLTEYFRSDSPNALKKCMKTLKTTEKELRKNLRHSIMCFHYYQDSIKQTIDYPVTNDYLISELAMYIDIRALDWYIYTKLQSNSEDERKEFTIKSASSILALLAVFGEKIHQILPVLLRSKYINSENKDFFDIIFRINSTATYQQSTLNISTVNIYVQLSTI